MKKFNENPHYMRITLHIESHFLLLGDLNLFTVISEFIFCLIPWTVFVCLRNIYHAFQTITQKMLVNVLNEGSVEVGMLA